jgi:hypothetical protein
MICDYLICHGNIDGSLFFARAMRQENARPSQSDSRRARQRVKRWEISQTRVQAGDRVRIRYATRSSRTRPSPERAPPARASIPDHPVPRDRIMRQLHRKLQRLLALGPRIRLSLRRRGLKSFMRRATVKIAGRLGWDIANPYLDWVEDHTPSASALAAQRRWERATPDLPRFTLVLRTEAKTRTNLSRTLRSLRHQTYCHWSTVVLRAEADASAVTLSQIGSDCDYVGNMRAGDTLSPEALYEFARAIVDRDLRPDVLYCDEDHFARDRRTRCRPNFKPSWSPETRV